jgi:hypothetical protein
MCTEYQTRFRAYGHTQSPRWEYCAVLPQRERTPETGLACRRYKRQIRGSREEMNCFHCKYDSSATDEKSNGTGSAVRRWFQRVLGRVGVQDASKT